MAHVRRISDGEEWNSVVRALRPADLIEIDAHCDMRRIARFVMSNCYGNAGVYTDAGELVGFVWVYGGVCIYIRPPLDRASPELREALEGWLGHFKGVLEAFVLANNSDGLTSWAELGFVPNGPPTLKPARRSLLSPKGPFSAPVLPPPEGFAFYRLTRSPTQPATL